MGLIQDDDSIRQLDVQGNSNQACWDHSVEETELAQGQVPAGGEEALIRWRQGNCVWPPAVRVPNRERTEASYTQDAAALPLHDMDASSRPVIPPDFRSQLLSPPPPPACSGGRKNKFAFRHCVGMEPGKSSPAHLD